MIDVQKWLQDLVAESQDLVARGTITTPLERMERRQRGIEFIDPAELFKAVAEGLGDLKRAEIREVLASDMRRAGFDPETGCKLMLPLRVKAWHEGMWPEFVIFSNFVDQKQYIPAKKAPR